MSVIRGRVSGFALLGMVIVGNVLGAGIASAQNVAPSIAGDPKTSARQETKEIDLAKISLESTGMIFSLAKELREIVSSEELSDLQFETDALVAEFDTIFKYRKETNLEMKNIRSIKNSINFWKQQLVEVESLDDKISMVNKVLDKNRMKYARDLAAWNDISKIAAEYQYSDVVMGRINQVTILLDSAINVSTQKSNITLGMLDQTNGFIIKINERIDRYDNVLIAKQNNIFKSGTRKASKPATGHDSACSLHYFDEPWGPFFRWVSPVA